MKHLLILLLSLLLHIQCFKGQNISVEDGLYSNYVYFVEQDSNEILWIGTDNGLFFYDGYKLSNIQNIQNTNGNVTSFNNFLGCYPISKDQLLLFNLNKGINILDLHTLRFVSNNYSSYFNGIRVNCCKIDSDNNLWFSTNKGVYKIENNTQTVIPIKGTENLTTYEFLILENHEIVFGTWQNGLLKVNSTTNEMSVLTCIDNSSGAILENLSVHSMHSDKNQRIWLGTWASNFFGSVKMTNDTLYLEHFSPESNPNIVSNIVTDILETNNRELIFIGPEGLDYIKYTDNDYQIHINNRISTDVKYHYTRGTIDRENNFFLGTSNKGIHSVRQTNLDIEFVSTNGMYDGYSGENVRTFHPISKNELLVGVQNTGFFKYTVDSKKLTHYKQFIANPNKLNHDFNTATSFLYDKNGILWMGSRYNNIYWIDHKWQIVNAYSNNLNINNYHIDNIYKDFSGNIWLSATNNLFYFKNQNKEYSKIAMNAVSSINFAQQSIDINDIEQDNDSNIWISTKNNGLMLLKYENLKNNEFTFEKLSDYNHSSIPTSFNCITKTKRFICAGSNGNGVYLVDKNFETKSINTGQYEAPKIIYSIEVENDSTIWIASEQGISLIRPHENDFQLQPLQFGSKVKRYSFYPNSSFFDTKSKIYFGAYDGFYVIDTKSRRTNRTTPNTIITEVNINDSSIFFPKNGTHIKASSKISHLKFHFTSSSLQIPEYNLYKYKLLPIENNWSFVNAQERTVQYNNLKPGNYQFVIRASNNNSFWDLNDYTFYVTVKPPLWKRWWVILIISVLWLLILYFFIKMFINTTELKHVEEFEKSDNEKLRTHYSSNPIQLPLVSKLSTEDAKFLKRLDEITRERYNDPDFKVPVLEELLLMSKATLFRRITRLTGMSGNEFIKNYRLHKAKALLDENKLTISEIAYATGFNDHSYFSYCFKVKFKQTPGEYISGFKGK